MYCLVVHSVCNSPDSVHHTYTDKLDSAIIIDDMCIDDKTNDYSGPLHVAIKFRFGFLTQMV